MSAVQTHGRDVESQPSVSSSASAASTDSNAIKDNPTQVFNTPKLLLLSGTVYISFLLHDYLQERIWRLPGFNFPQMMTLFEFFSCTIFPFVEIVTQNTALSRGNPVRFAALSLLVVTSMVLGTASLAYVSFPIKVVAKSTKLLPTMAAGTLLLGRRFLSWHYLAAACLCLGLAGFASSDPHTSGAGSTCFGISLLGCGTLAPQRPTASNRPPGVRPGCRCALMPSPRTYSSVSLATSRGATSGQARRRS
mmetsp:Transcript_2234/g.5283  ORF Transcript_2234/g.5283 Transcript_2234/m.5283 type:complete len:250 (+) Transcript_2234:246-995(+)